MHTLRDSSRKTWCLTPMYVSLYVCMGPVHFRMSFLNLISVSSFFILCCSFLIHAQQPHVGKTTTSNNPDTSNSNSTPDFPCIGLKRNCQAYLVFRSQPPCTSVASVAADPSDLSQRNSVSETETFETNKLVIEANNHAEQDSTIYPFTTLMVPLQDPPSSSQNMAPLPPLSGNSYNKNKRKTWIYILLLGTLGGCALILVFNFIIFFAFLHNGENESVADFVRETFEAYKKPVILQESPEFSESTSGTLQSLKVYSFKELQDATDDFSPSCCIKGSVYRGIINGDLVAIKKTNGDALKEINLLRKYKDINVVRLSGFCFNDGIWYLVYEHAVNGPLGDWIYNTENAGRALNWTQRMLIALDVAVGINYLHRFTITPLIHQDIRSNNVLLDSNLRAKIAGFGMARIAGEEEGQFALTRHIVGSKGHMAPEYLENGLVSTKLDVYAFGVLMLEMITGREVADLFTEENKNLSDVLCARFSGENVQESLMQFMDSSMEGKYPSAMAMSSVRLIYRCLDRDPACRPRMDEIVVFLARIYNDSLRWELPYDNNYSGNETSNTGF